VNSDDKLLAIGATGFFLGLIGGMTVGWPAIVMCGIAICAIAFSKTESNE